MITGFFILLVFYLVYRLNRDEGIIVILQERVAGLEKFVQSLPSDNLEKFSKVEEKNF